MRKAKLYKLFTISALTAMLAIGLISGIAPQGTLKKLSLKLHTRALVDGQSANSHGTVYYNVQDGRLVTKLDSPFDQLVVSSALGEHTTYEFETNQVMMSQGANLSSKNSFLYTFLSGQLSDMGLRGLGYKMVESKIEDNLLVTEWVAPDDRVSIAQNVKIVSENSLPIFIGFYDQDMNIQQKTYYTNYHPISYMQIPLTITEIQFISEVDSIITQRKYSDLALNSEVDEKWLNFNIPTDAKNIKMTK